MLALFVLLGFRLDLKRSVRQSLRWRVCSVGGPEGGHQGAGGQIQAVFFEPFFSLK